LQRFHRALRHKEPHAIEDAVRMSVRHGSCFKCDSLDQRSFWGSCALPRPRIVLGHGQQFRRHC
jgi:hypothetical protein